MNTEEEGSEKSWCIWGSKVPRSEIQFFSQVVILYTVILISIINLSVRVDNRELWTAILSSSLGYLLPNPSIKKKHVLFNPA